VGSSEPDTDTPVERSAAWCRSILAHAFLMNIARDPVRERKNPGNEGGLMLGRLMLADRESGTHKVLCLIQYFLSTLVPEGEGEGHEEKAEELKERQILFQKVSLDTETFMEKTPEWDENRFAFPGRPPLDLTTSSMEDPEAAAFVNFANQNFGYGKITEGCTQEEIMQLCCPEFNVGMLFFGLMEDDCVVMCHGAKRFSSYTGYGRGFKFSGPVRGGASSSGRVVAPYRQSIITMDAVFMRHCAFEKNVRDTKKATLAFREMRRWFLENEERSNGGVVTISTGKWGCGAFLGDPLHKFLQQYVAGLLTGVRLRFSLFGEDKERADCEAIARACSELTARSVWAVVLQIRPQMSREAIVQLLEAARGQGNATGGEGAAEGKGKRWKTRDASGPNNSPCEEV